MTLPTLEVFNESAYTALERIHASKGALALFRDKGPAFDFESDGCIDSLELLDIVHFMEKDLNTKIDVESLLHDELPITLGRLFGAAGKN